MNKHSVGGLKPAQFKASVVYKLKNTLGCSPLKKMIRLLYVVIAAEMFLILCLLFKTPFRKLLIMALDRVKRGRGPLVIKTVAGTVLVVLASSVYSMFQIRSRTDEAGAVNPTDQVLESKHLLEASLMGFLLFLSLMMDRLHHYIRELRFLRKSMEAAKKQSRGSEDGKSDVAEDLKLKALREEVDNLKKRIKKMESDTEVKAKEAKAAEAEAEALRKQSEGILLEYDRLLEDNQNLRNQLESFDHGITTHSNGKKNM